MVTSPLTNQKAHCLFLTNQRPSLPVRHPLRLKVNLGLLGLRLLLELLGLDLLLLAVVVGEVVHHDGDGEGHDQHPAHRAERAHDLT